MATTDSRTGFRLPWSTDRAASREASADPAEAPAGATDPGADGGEHDAAAGAAGAPDATQSIETGVSRDVSGDAARGQQEKLVTTLALDAAPHGVEAAPDVVHAAPAGQPHAAAPGHRPTKFLADLTRAMQAAAEQARAATLDQFRADGTTVIEQIHARSTTGAVDLRRRADDDVAAIKEWSKSEIARVREETERRVGARREQLEGQLERHAALIEHEIEKVRGRVARFETEMGSFFDVLLTEDDPAVFAARAASLPEAPSFADLEEDALAALLGEPGVGVPETMGAIEAPPEPAAVVAVEAPETGIPEPVESPEATAEMAPAADVAAPLDREAAIAAIAAAAEAAEAAAMGGAAEDRVEAATAEDAAQATAEPAAEALLEDDAAASSPDEADATAEPVDSAPEPADTITAAEPAVSDAPELDPRLAMLGLTPDFAAAEAAAAEAAVSDVEDMPEIGGDALEARLSGLVPSDASHAAAAATVTTQLVTTGLVSVASIASFKRHLGRLAGVGHVGVSSGPDGEFVFSVEHDPATSLRELVPTIPGFAARVVGSGDGFVQVSAQDPQD